MYIDTISFPRLRISAPHLAVMDPVSAIGLASPILAFVEFSWGLVQGASDIYTSPTGLGKENTSINTVIADLEGVTNDINASIRGYGKHEKALSVISNKFEAPSIEL